MSKKRLASHKIEQRERISFSKMQDINVIIFYYLCDFFNFGVNFIKVIFLDNLTLIKCLFNF